MVDKEQALLSYNGHDLRVAAVLAAGAEPAPRFPVKLEELIIPQHPLYDELKLQYKGPKVEPKKGHVLVTKYKTGYAVLLGDVSPNLKKTEDGMTVVVTLISSHALKRARVLDDADVAPAAPSGSSDPRTGSGRWSSGDTRTQPDRTRPSYRSERNTTENEGRFKSHLRNNTRTRP